MPTDLCTALSPPLTSPNLSRLQFLRRSSTSSLLSKSQPQSLFDRIPLELHAEIFSHCLPPFPQVAQNDASGPVLIAQVCRAWRGLAHATPRLWSSFEIEVEDSICGDELGPTGPISSPYSLRTLSRVRLWLERSKNQPLAFRLTHLPTGRTPNELSAQLLALLVLHARRWRTVEIVVPSTSLAAAMQRVLPEDFPVMRSLTLHMKGAWNHSPPGQRRSVSIIPWTQLTDLDLRLDNNHMLTLDDYAGLLRGATSLRTCKVNATCALSRPSTTLEREPFLLPSLHTLHLILQGGGAAEDSEPGFLAPAPSFIAFLGLFSGCSLSELSLKWLVDGHRAAEQSWASTDIASTALATFLKGTALSLRSLNLYYIPLAAEALMLCLAGLDPTRLDLRFSLADQLHDPVGDALLRALTVPKGKDAGESESTKTLAPSLRHLHLQCTGERCSQAALLDLINSRRPQLAWGEATGLKTFEFHSMQQVIDGVRPRVKKWLEEGMDVTIESVVLL